MPEAKRELVHPRPLAGQRPVTSPSPAVGLTKDLFSAAALAALGPAAAALPRSLWDRALRDPVLELLQRPGKGFRQRLTETAYRLAGGEGSPPPRLGALLEVIHAGSMIVDDIEDGSDARRGGPAVHRLHGVPLALNAGNWMYFAPLDLIGQLGLSPGAELHLRQRATRTLLDCHYGQALDLAARPDRLDRQQVADVVRAISTLKTGRLLGLCAEAGAILAGADHAMQAALHRFGEALGVGLQMLDDLGNLTGKLAPDRRHEDLRRGRVTWAWAWAASLLDQAAFAELGRQSLQVRDPEPAAGAGADSSSAAVHREDQAARLRRCDLLAGTLRTLVVGHGRLYAHWHLAEALADLRGHVPPGQAAALHLLETEIIRLEVSYG
jgi:geranylgeranyl pyrophosphate synthase